jgi:hypothetical protein
VRRTVPPSAEIEARIEHMLSVGVGENPHESLSELAKLGARLIIQRAANLRKAARPPARVIPLLDPPRARSRHPFLTLGCAGREDALEGKLTHRDGDRKLLRRNGNG